MNATIHNFNNAEKRTISAEGHIVPVLSLITTFHSQTIIIKITSTTQRIVGIPLSAGACANIGAQPRNIRQT